jgi:hypothetical protein
MTGRLLAAKAILRCGWSSKFGGFKYEVQQR